MLSLGLGQSLPPGINLQAFTIYVYKSFFILTANKTITAITTKIKIDKHTHDITELEQEEIIPPTYQKQILCSAFMGILPILNKTYLLIVQLCQEVCKIDSHSIFQLKQVALIPFENQEALNRDGEGNLTQKSIKVSQQNAKIISLNTYLKNYLLIQGYYFSFRYDLSLSRSAHALGNPRKKKFIWNKNIAKNIQKLKDRRWFIVFIQGFVRNFSVVIKNGMVLEYYLITRRSWTKGGTRYNSRGIDIKGNVANFCQTQQIIFIAEKCFSHLFIRGSVPCFWKQTGIYGQVEIMKPFDQNLQIFKKHFRKLLKNYNKVLNVNLLCKYKQGQQYLTQYYEKMMKDAIIKDVKYEFFDVHAASKGLKFDRCNYLIDKIAEMNQYFGFYEEDVKSSTILSLQNGVVRVNCLDNLDRTNLIGSKIAYQVLTYILESIQIDVNKLVGSNSILTAADNINNTSTFIIHLKNTWADNGDTISKHYTGTGSTHTNITRSGQRNIKGMMDHGFKSCRRLFQQFVDDNQKQEAIDILLGQHTQTVNLSEIESRLKQFGMDQDQTDKMVSSTVQNWE